MRSENDLAVCFSPIPATSAPPIAPNTILAWRGVPSGAHALYLFIRACLLYLQQRLFFSDHGGLCGEPCAFGASEFWALWLHDLSIARLANSRLRVAAKYVARPLAISAHYFRVCLDRRGLGALGLSGGVVPAVIFAS